MKRWMKMLLLGAGFTVLLCTSALATGEKGAYDVTGSDDAAPTAQTAARGTPETAAATSTNLTFGFRNGGWSGETYTVEVVATAPGSFDVQGAECTVKFDKAVLRCTNAEFINDTKPLGGGSPLNVLEDRVIVSVAGIENQTYDGVLPLMALTFTVANDTVEKQTTTLSFLKESGGPFAYALGDGMSPINHTVTAKDLDVYVEAGIPPTIAKGGVTFADSPNGSVEIDGRDPGSVQMRAVSMGGTDLTDRVSWSVSPTTGGVSVNASTGLVTVAARAVAGNYTITATGNDITARGSEVATLQVIRADSAVQSIAIYQGDTKLGDTAAIIVPASGANTYTYTARGVDQFGVETTVAWDWSFEVADGFVAFRDGTVTVNAGAARDKSYTLTAQAGEKSASVTLITKDIDITWPSCTEGIKTGFYGQTWSEVVNFSQAGGSATLDTRNVPGTFTLEDESKYPQVVDTTYTVRFRSDDGTYNVAKDFPATIARRSVASVTVDAIPAQTYTGSAITPAITVQDGGRILTLNADYTVVYTNNTNAGTATVTITGKGNYDSATTRAAYFTISPRPVTITGITAGDKVYDGTVAATIVTTNAQVSGVADADRANVTIDVTAATGTFNNKNVGTGKTVTITGIKLGGTAAGSYTLTGTGATATADITKRDIKVTGGVTASNKAYDRGDSATLSAKAPVFDALVSGDHLTVTATGTFASADAGVAKAITITGITLGGTDAGNYHYTGHTLSLTADITKRPLTVTNGTLTITKEFDTTTALPTDPAPDFTKLGLTGVLAGDVVTIKGTATAYDSANVAANHTVSVAVELAGDQGDNYTITSPYIFTGAVITKILPTLAQVTGDVAFTAATYDGTAKTITETVGKENAAGLGDMTVRYRSKDSTGAFVTPTGAGEYDVYACFTEGTDYGAADVKLAHTFTINKAARNLALDNTALVLKPGALTATLGVTYANADNSAVVTYTGATTAVTRSGDSFTAVDNGTMTVTVSIAATDNYNAAEERTATITAWANPAQGLTVKTTATSPATTDADKVAYTLSGSAVTVTGIKAEDNGINFEISAGRTLVDAGGKLIIRSGDVTLAEYTVIDSTAPLPTITVGDTTAGLELKSDDPKMEVSDTLGEKKVDVAIALGTANRANNRLDGVVEAAAGYLADEAKSAAARSQAAMDAIKSDPRIEVKVSMDIKAVDAASVTDGEQSLTLEVKPMYTVVANGRDENGASVGEIVLRASSALPNTALKGTVTVNVTLPSYLRAALTGGALFVDHIKSGGGTESIKATLNGDQTIASWQVTEFSTFKLSVQGDTKTVTFTRGDGTTFTDSFDYTRRGQALPSDSKSGSTFDGWTIGGAEYQTVSEAFLAAIAANQSAVARFTTNTATDPSNPGNPSNPSNPSGGSSGGGSSSDGSRDDRVAVSASGRSHGRVTLSSSDPKTGDTVTITVKVDNGYQVDMVRVTTSSGREVTVRSIGDDQFTFTMPNSAVKVSVTYRLLDAPEPQSFTDVPSGHWARAAIQWVNDNGYMMGNSATTFNPEGCVTRQQLWMIMARMAGADPHDFAGAKAWAIANNISDGSAPGSAATRQQMVTILFRYMRMMGLSISGGADLASFPDSGSVAPYAQEALRWSVGNSIVDSTADGRLNPSGTATRAQFAAILQGFCQTVV